jgi:hypothetical protein
MAKAVGHTYFDAPAFILKNRPCNSAKNLIVTRLSDSLRDQILLAISK